MLLMNFALLFQDVFAHAGFSTIKTLVMMLGEIDFGGMLAQNVTKVGIVPTSQLPYPEFTIIYFVVFVALISILLMNLLVGVAINNVNSVEDSAVLQRLSMQVGGHFNPHRLKGRKNKDK